MLIRTEVETKKRLLVLVPEGLSDDIHLAKNVYALALRDRCDVLYLSVVEDPDNRLAVMRRLATLSALTADDAVNVKSVVLQAQDWIRKLQDTCRPGDRVVCLVDRSLKESWLNTIPVQETLQKELDVPVVVLAGEFHPSKNPSRKWLYSLLYWLGCLVVVAGFTLLEIQISHGLQGIARTALFTIALTVEFGLIYVWNRVPKA